MSTTTRRIHWGRVLAALLAAAVVSALLPATSRADVMFGSSLNGSPTVTKSSSQDAVYWANRVAGGTPCAPSAGQVKSVSVKGYWDGTGSPQIYFQVLRPQPDGSFLVVETSQPFTMPSSVGTYTFMPTSMTVQAGDCIGLATIGGGFVVGANVSGSATDDFQGHNQDMNNDFITPQFTETNVELLLQVDLVPPSSSGPPPPPPGNSSTPPGASPCKCAQVSAFLNRASVYSVAHGTEVGFVLNWRLVCSAGTGTGCRGQIKVFVPGGAKLLDPPNKAQRILNVSCAGPCAKPTTGTRMITWVALTAGKHPRPIHKFTPRGRANKDREIRLSLSCVDASGVAGPGRVVKLTVHFDRLGQVDYAKSDLNGDGRPDRGQLRGY